MEAKGQGVVRGLLELSIEPSQQLALLVDGKGQGTVRGLLDPSSGPSHQLALSWKGRSKGLSEACWTFPLALVSNWRSDGGDRARYRGPWQGRAILSSGRVWVVWAFVGPLMRTWFSVTQAHCGLGTTSN